MIFSPCGGSSLATGSRRDPNSADGSRNQSWRVGLSSWRHVWPRRLALWRLPRRQKRRGVTFVELRSRGVEGNGQQKAHGVPGETRVVQDWRALGEGERNSVEAVALCRS